MSSLYDADIHYISYNRLIRLYGVNPTECIDASKIVGPIDETNMISLKPRFYGDYDEFLQTLQEKQQTNKK